MPKEEKMYQITVKYTKWPQNIPNGCKKTELPQNIPILQDPQKFTQILV
jgi:hypothetical protein